MTEEMYKSLLLSLHDTLQGNDDKPIETDDENLSRAAASQTRRQDEEYNNRNRLYTQLLETYIENYRRKEKSKGIYKCIFFIITICLFLGIIVCGLAGIIILSVYGDGSWTNVGIAIANIVGIISTLIILPRIIAEHLFPTNEESNMLEMVKNMQDNDASIRQVLFDEDEESQLK